MPGITLGDLYVEVVQKAIKNVHLTVHPPDGRVRVSAPAGIDLETIRAFVISKMPWIRKQQNRLVSQEREAPRDMINRESHYYNGKRYLLKVVERNQTPEVDLSHRIMTLFVRPGTDTEKRQVILKEWYRQQLKQSIPTIIQHYEPIMQVKVAEFGIKQMKTRWGTCNTAARRIWINLELAKKPPECLEYIVVHEMVHLLERSHNHRFVAFMDQFLPKWRAYKDELDRLPVYYTAAE